MTQANSPLEGAMIESPRPVLKGEEFEEQCLLHAETGFPLMVQSTPGAGKTQKSKRLPLRYPELAEIMGYERGEDIPTALIPAQQAEMENITGYVFLSKKEDGGQAKADWILPPFYSQQPMLVIIDEVNRAKEPTRGALFPALTGDPMINGFRFHPKTLFILLGNSTEHGAGVRELDRALKGRMGHYTYEPMVQDWITNFAAPEGANPVVIGFIQAFPQYLNYFDPKSRSDAQPMPRTWYEGVSKPWSSTRRSLESKKRAVQGAIGKFVGDQFIEYATRMEFFPTPEQLAGNPGGVAIPKELDGLFMLAQSLGQHLAQPIDAGTSRIAAGAAHVLGRMAAEGYLEPVVLAARSAMKRMNDTKAPTCLVLPEVQTVMRAFPEITDFLVKVGRAQMGTLR